MSTLQLFKYYRLTLLDLQSWFVFIWLDVVAQYLGRIWYPSPCGAVTLFSIIMLCIHTVSLYTVNDPCCILLSSPCMEQTSPRRTAVSVLSPHNVNRITIFCLLIIIVAFILIGVFTSYYTYLLIYPYGQLSAKLPVIMSSVLYFQCCDGRTNNIRTYRSALQTDITYELYSLKLALNSLMFIYLLRT